MSAPLVNCPLLTQINIAHRSRTYNAVFNKYRVRNLKFATYLKFATCENTNKTRLGQLGANISPDRSSLTPQVLIGNFLFNPFVVCHKYWEKLYELQHINLLSLYLPKEDGVSPDVEYITQQIIFSIFLQ